jgi:hypothetical protein
MISMLQAAVKKWGGHSRVGGGFPHRILPQNGGSSTCGLPAAEPPSHLLPYRPTPGRIDR